jgi:hypothetical protein
MKRLHDVSSTKRSVPSWGSIPAGSRSYPLSPQRATTAENQKNQSVMDLGQGWANIPREGPRDSERGKEGIERSP